MRIRAMHDEAQAINNAERRGEKRRDEHWKGVAIRNEKLNAQNEKLNTQLAELKSRLGDVE